MATLISLQEYRERREIAEAPLSTAQQRLQAIHDSCEDMERTIDRIKRERKESNDRIIECLRNGRPTPIVSSPNGWKD